MREIATTIKDVAKYTGLSIATISKYINGGNVLARNREVIEKAIDVLDFKVNEMARGLKTSQSKIIGILIPNLEQPFCTSIVSNIENILIQYGYSTMICDYKESLTLEEVKLKFLMSKRVDGIVMMPFGEEEELIRTIIPEGFPVVLIDRILPSTNYDTVLVDNLNASYDALEQLIKRGHKKIGIITGPQDVYTARERLKGYYRVFEDYNLPIDIGLIKEGDYKVGSGYTLLKELMSKKEPPTALFITNYEMTLGAIMAINEENINVPGQLSIIGFDNQQFMSVVKPPLSVVEQPIQQIGESVAEILLKRLAQGSKHAPHLIRLKGKVLIKQSVRSI
ncbi:MAG: LacI family DNA-binding transcriptional regulator [Cellulosilyticaceae bacterium]